MFFSNFGNSFRIGERPLVITSASQLPNLEIWYYADVNTTVGVTTGQEVTAWANAGGLTSHDWNSTGGKRPEWFSNIQNGKGVVRFNGPGSSPTGEDADTDEYLSINPVTYINSLAGATMVIVFRTLSVASGTRYVASTDVGGFQFGVNGTQYVGGFAGATFTVDTLVADTNFHHVILTFDGSQADNAGKIKVRIDGDPVTLTFTGTANSATSSSAAYLFGGCTGTGSSKQSNYWIGDLGEYIVWTRALKLSESLAVEQYLTNKWAI